MRITLNSKGDYAVRAVLQLARVPGGRRCKAREIAEAMRIPQSYLAIILAELVRAGLLVATAGKDGGYALARPDVSLLDVVEVAEGPVRLEHCMLRGIPCGQDGYCAAHEAWSSAQDALTAQLARTSFAALARAEQALRDNEVTRDGSDLLLQSSEAETHPSRLTPEPCPSGTLVPCEAEPAL